MQYPLRQVVEDLYHCRNRWLVTMARFWMRGNMQCRLLNLLVFRRFRLTGNKMTISWCKIVSAGVLRSVICGSAPTLIAAAQQKKVHCLVMSVWCLHEMT